MLRDSDMAELIQGQIVYLYPHTKTASRACHEMRMVRVMHDRQLIRKHWPLLVVEWKQDGKDVWERVHRDNVRLRPVAKSNKSDKGAGDGPSAVASKWAAKVRVMPGKIKPIDLAEGEEQGTLF
jgi:hypothetical protein